jgi:uncharacterized damage-inducible protein DinB
MPDLHRLFAYNDWANRETLISLKRTGAPPAKAARYLGHVLAAERLWLGRLAQDPAKVPVWPEPTLDECEARIGKLAALWKDYLASLTPEKLARQIPYTNTLGQAWTNTVEDILTHVVMHSAYHRAQVAAELRAAGHEPAYTDFIHAVRQGFVK